MPSLDSHALILAAGMAAAAWLALTLWIVGNRLLYDARNRGLGWAVQALREPQLAAQPLAERMAAVHRILKRLPLRSLETLVMDTSLPGWARDACSVQVERLRDPARLLATARSGPERGRKWDYISALFVLARERHPDSHALLARALDAKDPEIRNTAITLLGEIGDRQAAEVLIAGLHTAGSLRARIASQLDRFHLPIGELLRPLAASADPAVRAWGALLLWRYADLPGMDAHLAALARDPDPGVRKAAVQSLAEVATPLAATTARGLLRDAAPFVRAHATRTLVRTDPEGAAADIAPLLADPDWWVRQATKESLSRLGLRAMPQVLAQLDSPDRFARNGAADVLQEIGATALLVERARQQGPESTEASALLRRIMQAGERDMVGAGAPLHPSWQPSRAAVTAGPQEWT